MQQFFQKGRWDEEISRPVKADKDDEVSIEDELDMLNRFHQLHELGHAFWVSPKDGRYAEAIGVHAIPQAV